MILKFFSEQLINVCVYLVLNHLKYNFVNCLFLVGSFRQLQESGLDFTKMMGEPQKELEEETQVRELIRQGSSKSIHSHEASEIPQETEEQKSTGSVGAYVYKAYFKAGGNCCVIFMLFFLFVAAQLFGSAADYFITFW